MNHWGGLIVQVQLGQNGLSVNTVRQWKNIITRALFKLTLTPMVPVRPAAIILQYLHILRTNFNICNCAFIIETPFSVSICILDQTSVPGLFVSTALILADN